jgi:hypothetical protein
MYTCILNDHFLTVKSELISWSQKQRQPQFYCTEYNLKDWTKQGFYLKSNGEQYGCREPSFNVNASDEKWVRKYYFNKVDLKETDFKREKNEK